MYWSTLCGLFLILVVTVTKAVSTVKCSKLGCSHTCVDEVDGPECTCQSDMILGSDGKTCVVPAGVLLAMYRGVKVYSEGSSEPRTITTAKVKSLDYHYRRKEIYAYTNYSILRFSQADGKTSDSEQSNVVLTVDTAATSMAVDWVHDRLYWVSEQKSAVESATIDGEDRKVILTHNNTDESPQWNNIVIDPNVKKLFWIGKEGLYSASLDGKDLQKISSVSIKVEDIALDTTNKLIYVIGNRDLDNKKYIGRRHYDGSSAGEDFMINQDDSHVFGFGILGKQVFWESSYDGLNLFKGQLPETGNIKDIKLVEELNQLVYDMKIYHPDVQNLIK